MNILPILDSLSWRSDPKVLVNIKVSPTAREITMTAMDLISCGLFENDTAIVNSKIIKVAKGDHPQNHKITLHISPVDALNLKVSAGDDVVIERVVFDNNVADKVEIKRFWDFSDEIVVELDQFLKGKIIREGDVLEIDFNPDKGSLRENVSPKFKDMMDFPILKKPSIRGYIQIGSIIGDKSNSDSFLVDTKKTAIIMNGLASSRLPYRLNEPMMDVLNANPAYLKISGLVKACFSGKYPLFTVLLHGKQGIGKTTLLNTISKIFGVLLVTINFLKVINDDKTEMIARLELEVDEAMKMTPLILCLDNIDVLLRDSVHKGN